MIFTVYYMYATFLQWWRLGTLKNKIAENLNPQNALLVCVENVAYDTKKVRSFENLLFHNGNRIGCTVVPKQKITLSQWVSFPKDHRYFPIYFKSNSPKIESPHVYLLVQAKLDSYTKHSADLLQIENFGELVAWRVADQFEAVIKTDFNKLSWLVHSFSQQDIDINHELKLLKVETVDVDGIPTKAKYEHKFSSNFTRKYSHSPLHWKKFVQNLKEIYSKARDTTNPKITIETGRSDDTKKVPVSEVKPIKKDSKKPEDKNTLEVTGDYRRHKSGEHKREKNAEKHKSDHSKVNGAISKAKEKPAKEETKKDTGESSRGKKTRSDEPTTSTKTHKHTKIHKKEESTKSIETNAQEEPPKDDVDQEKPKAESSKVLSKRSSSSEKKLVKSHAVCEEVDGDDKTKKPIKTKAKSKEQLLDFAFGNGTVINRSTTVKPPNVLVYADSLVAKENVKSALSSMLNGEKYVIYDLPTDTDKAIWDSSTILVVVCGTVPPNLIYHLLQYLIKGGQLLCLCSDLLYSVLHTFTTAEVREHELVRFSYGKWKQVRMMHHIFCYQASPAKKQFSRDSDHSNPSSGNGSSPIAPRTPSTVELQHNGRDYTMQVQVLGTEETWQTPSLLLASVKGGEGRAVFSQVHLEINPSEYEFDENKFEVLKESDQARMEILKDILSTHLDMDCNGMENSSYTPGYFLGRHEMKLKLLHDTDIIRNNEITMENLSVKFCGKDEKADAPTKTFLPIYIHACPANFSTVNYFEALGTEAIGRLVIYCDIVSSSQLLLGKKLTHGLVIIPRQQTHAIGRSKNTWISPVGSANFSLQLHIPLSSPLGRSLPLVQHLIMVGVISAIKNVGNCKELNVGIKWPNDLYANGITKVGGVLVNSIIESGIAVVNIGCGINLDNVNPTLSINDLIRTTNDTKGTFMKIIAYEIYFATVFNEIERIYKMVQEGNMDYLFELYYKYWLHQDARITVTMKNGHLEKAKVVGLDEFGFLKVKLDDGTITKVEPDGNTFDMMKGLICPKSF